MPEPINPRGQDNPSQYAVTDRNNEAEMIRLMIQDRPIPAGPGGPLAEQPDPGLFARVLDIGCGPGGWLLETAALYPHMSLVGIDISWRMIEYARGQALAQKVSHRTEFLVADALRPFDFPDDAFDLVNMRLGSSFLLVKDWPRLLREMLRVTRPGGIVRLTDNSEAWESTSSNFNRIGQMFLCALYRSGRHVSEQAGLGHELPELLSESGCQQVQSKDYTLELVAGTVGGQNFYQNMMFGFQTMLPCLQIMGCASEDYDAVREQALIEMQQPDFRATWEILTAWSTKPT